MRRAAMRAAPLRRCPTPPHSTRAPSARRAWRAATAASAITGPGRRPCRRDARRGAALPPRSRSRHAGDAG
eukprot:357102-Chlamydomonas_euryale.AAC.3